MDLAYRVIRVALTTWIWITRRWLEWKEQKGDQVKTLLFIVSLMLTNCVMGKDDSKNAPASPNSSQVLLEKFNGRLSTSEQNNVVSECSLTSTSANLADKVDHVKALIEKAKAEPTQTAYHIVAQVPSIEIFAYHHPASGDPEKILLVEDYSVLKYREGPASKELVDLVNKFCK
jgi:hypothetical protein